MKNILVVAGSDPSGGAGVELAIKLFQKLDVYTLNVVTAYTIQNSKGVEDIIFSNKCIFEKQLYSLSCDFKIDAIKIEIIAKKELIDIFIKWYNSLSKKVPIIIDTVLISSSNKKLLNEDYKKSYTELLKLATIITPNFKEAEMLSGENKIEEIVKYFNLLGVEKGVITGGDLESDFSCDYIFCNDQILELKEKKIYFDTEVHGTGCFFSNVLIYHYMNEKNFITAVKKSKEMIGRYLKDCTKKIASGYYYFII